MKSSIRSLLLLFFFAYSCINTMEQLQEQCCDVELGDFFSGNGYDEYLMSEQDGDESFLYEVQKKREESNGNGKIHESKDGFDKVKQRSLREEQIEKMKKILHDHRREDVQLHEQFLQSVLQNFYGAEKNNNKNEDQIPTKAQEFVKRGLLEQQIASMKKKLGCFKIAQEMGRKKSEDCDMLDEEPKRRNQDCFTANGYESQWSQCSQQDQLKIWQDKILLLSSQDQEETIEQKLLKIKSLTQISIPPYYEPERMEMISDGFACCKYGSALPIIEQAPIKPVICNYCIYSFYTPYEMKLHNKKMHCDLLPIRCKQCRTQFTTKEAKRFHKQVRNH